MFSSKKCKNYFSLLFLVILLLFPFTISTQAEQGYANFNQRFNCPNFKDVSEQSWYISSVRKSCELGIMQGVSNLNFDPNGQVSIAEAITMAVRLYDFYYDADVIPAETSFPWYQKYVDTAIEYNIINDHTWSDYTQPITRVEFATIYLRLFPFTEQESINHYTVLDIPDIDDGTLSSNQIVQFYNYGIMTGDNQLNFNPHSYITRAEVAAIVSRMANPQLRQKLPSPKQAIAEKHIEKPYNWYVNQDETGIHSNNNCGPAVTSMMLKWYNNNLDVSPENLRSHIKPNGDWWTTDDIKYILDQNSIPYAEKNFNNINQLIQDIDTGKIILLCLDAYYINDYYEYPNSGHFIIIKGYVNENGTILFETYDPNNNNKNHYYFSDNIKRATDIWWPYYFSIGA